MASSKWFLQTQLLRIKYFYSSKDEVFLCLTIDFFPLVFYFPLLKSIFRVYIWLLLPCCNYLSHPSDWCDGCRYYSLLQVPSCSEKQTTIGCETCFISLLVKHFILIKFHWWKAQMIICLQKKHVLVIKTSMISNKVSASHIF